MTDLIDGNWFDMATVGVAILYACARCFTKSERRSWEAFASDLSYGVVIFPMLLLSLTFLSTRAFEALLAGNKIIISLAGVFSLIVILKRSFEKSPSPPTWT
ncbi:hypothetical protein CAL18_12535 [Bordetella genomosp. 7]|uniref:hypothetical protein n=1 Tax=Bordetella genomosp. 7 TaxID=1416805 RepID=UPI000B9E4FC5|nr:hypothetical protein [Bordetella genomosp. 7]OZI21744.1 hypothetical protein CAL18_12535 [Bordetella genomosp. 7]